MNLFGRKPRQSKNTFMTDKPVGQHLIAGWYVDMANVQDWIDNGDSAQLVNYDDLMVVYGSALSNPKDKSENSVDIEKVEKDKKGNWTLRATVRHPGHILILVVTYEDESQKSEAKAIINSARYEGK